MPKHKYGSGSLYRRGKIWWLSYYTNTERVYESSHTSDKGEAKRLLQQRIGQIAEGRYMGTKPDRVCFEELAEDMLNDYRINKKKSINDAIRSVSALARFFAGRKVQSITPAEISEYIASRQADGLGNGSINRELA